MTTWAEMLGDGLVGREESLRLARGFEPLPTPLALTYWLVQVLRTVVEIAMLAMVHAWEYLALGGSVALEFVSDDFARDVG